MVERDRLCFRNRPDAFRLWFSGSSFVLTKTMLKFYRTYHDGFVKSLENDLFIWSFKNPCIAGVKKDGSSVEYCVKKYKFQAPNSK